MEGDTIEEAEKDVNGNDDDVVLFLLMVESKKESVKNKLWLAKDVKQPSKADMMCTIDGDNFYLFTKNTWIGDSSALCHITNK